MVSDMPTIDATRLESTATRIFQGLGASPGDAAWIARLLVLANLRGHDSHGVIRIPQYAGTLMICLDVDRFVPLPEFHKQVAALVGWVKSAPLALGSKEILNSGEPEARLPAEGRRDGVPVADETWNQIERVAAEPGVG